MQDAYLDKKMLKKFGITMAAAFIIISCILFFRQKHVAAEYCLVVSGIFFIMALVFPRGLKRIYIIWMRLAFILSWINTRIILIILFFLIFTPLGLFMRLFKVDLLERKNQKATYWKKKAKAEFDPLNYERRF